MTADVPRWRRWERGRGMTPHGQVGEWRCREHSLFLGVCMICEYVAPGVTWCMEGNEMPNTDEPRAPLRTLWLLPGETPLEQGQRLLREAEEARERLAAAEGLLDLVQLGRARAWTEAIERVHAYALMRLPDLLALAAAVCAAPSVKRRPGIDEPVAALTKATRPVESMLLPPPPPQGRR
jgi:hypothetical protein